MRESYRTGRVEKIFKGSFMPIFRVLLATIFLPLFTVTPMNAVLNLCKSSLKAVGNIVWNPQNTVVVVFLTLTIEIL